ncbi:MAG TPA: hypothetical protein VNT75_16190 [Symbiobacteriaceae bacterium]|nr:hypothetical protein [Symbiobacteriaceae bacterium]
MRRRPYVALVFLALALTTTVSVMAFRRAQVTNGAQITVASTDTAMLAVKTVDLSIASYVNNYVHLSFPNQQPNSTYVYNGVFKVQNRTPGTITLSVDSVTGEGTPGAHLTIADATTGTVYWQNGTSSGTRSMTSLLEATMNVTIRLDSGMAIGSPINLSITVRGQ